MTTLKIVQHTPDILKAIEKSREGLRRIESLEYDAVLSEKGAKDQAIRIFTDFLIQFYKEVKERST